MRTIVVSVSDKMSPCGGIRWWHPPTADDIMTGALSQDRNLICPHKTFRASSVLWRWGKKKSGVITARDQTESDLRNCKREKWRVRRLGFELYGWKLGFNTEQSDVETLFSSIIDALSVSLSSETVSLIVSIGSNVPHHNVSSSILPKSTFTQ